jgi:hypothetical protein
MFQTSPFYHAVLLLALILLMERERPLVLDVTSSRNHLPQKSHSFALHHSLINRCPSGCNPTGLMEGTHPADTGTRREARTIFESLKQKEKREYAKKL